MRLNDSSIRTVNSKYIASVAIENEALTFPFFKTIINNKVSIDRFYHNEKLYKTRQHIFSKTN